MKLSTPPASNSSPPPPRLKSPLESALQFTAHSIIVRYTLDARRSLARPSRFPLASVLLSLIRDYPCTLSHNEHFYFSHIDRVIPSTSGYIRMHTPDITPANAISSFFKQQINGELAQLHDIYSSLQASTDYMGQDQRGKSRAKCSITPHGNYRT